MVTIEFCPSRLKSRFENFKEKSVCLASPYLASKRERYSFDHSRVEKIWTKMYSSSSVLISAGCIRSFPPKSTCIQSSSLYQSVFDIVWLNIHFRSSSKKRQTNVDCTLFCQKSTASLRLSQVSFVSFVCLSVCVWAYRSTSVSRLASFPLLARKRRHRSYLLKITTRLVRDGWLPESLLLPVLYLLL